MSVVSDVESEVLHVVGDRIRPVIEGAQSDGMFEMFVVEGEIGSGPPPHAHPWAESYYVIEGRLQVEIGHETAMAGPGDAAVVPAGSVHRFEVASETVKFIVASGGDRASRFFRDMAAHAPGVPSPETLPTIIDVAKRHGLTSPLFDG